MKFFVDQGMYRMWYVWNNLPRRFSMNDDNVSEAIEGDVAEEFIDAALEAEESCPVSCISHQE